MLNEKSAVHSKEEWKWKYSNVIGTCLLLLTLLCTSYLFRDYIQAVLRWVESQPDTVVFCILVGLYTLVSLPLAWGYIIINIATGYLYGLKIGILVTFASATLGIIIAHYIIKAFLVGYVQRLINNYAGSVLKKLDFLMSSKKDAFQLVLLSRLTPIPFGLQNSLFALSPMSIDKYLQASCLGLLPCQIINVYLGSTLRSMEEVLGDSNTATVGVIVLICQLAFVGLVVLFVAQKAKQQLDLTINTSEPENLGPFLSTSNEIEVVVIHNSSENNKDFRK